MLIMANCYNWIIFFSYNFVRMNNSREAFKLYNSVFKIINKLYISLMKLMILLEVVPSRKLIHFSFNDKKSLVSFSFFFSFLLF